MKITLSKELNLRGIVHPAGSTIEADQSLQDRLKAVGVSFTIADATHSVGATEVGITGSAPSVVVSGSSTDAVGKKGLT